MAVKHLSFAIVSALIIFTSPNALAAGGAHEPVDQHTSKAFKAFCAGDDEDLAYCYGYMNGVSTLFSLSVNGRGICVPEHATFGEQKLVWMRYLDENPDKLSDVAAFTFAEAMRANYPCKK